MPCAGLGLAAWGSAALLRLASGGPPVIPLDVRLDGRVLVFTAVLALLTGLVFGLTPALRATRVELAAALRTQGRGVTGAARGPGGWHLGKVLVAAQVGDLPDPSHRHGDAGAAASSDSRARTSAWTGIA